MSNDFALNRVPINIQTVSAFRASYNKRAIALDEELILEKNREYGDSWQAEGPFVAAGRLKDKIIRVETIIEESNAERRVAQTTYEGGFENILEAIAYCKLLALYWVWNDLGVDDNAPQAVVDFYEGLSRLLDSLDE